MRIAICLLQVVLVVWFLASPAWAVYYVMYLTEKVGDKEYEYYDIGKVDGELVAIHWKEAATLRRNSHQNVWRGPEQWARDYGRGEAVVVKAHSGSDVLSYDTSGKTPRVSIGKPGQQWNITGAEPYSDKLLFQAAEGDVKGWWLDLGEEQTFKVGNVEFKAHRLILVEKRDQTKNRYFRFNEMGGK